MGYSDQEPQNTYQQSFLITTNEDDDYPTAQLSGDESGQASVATVSQQGDKKANFLLSVTTIMKTVIGAGILSLPLTVSRLGFGLAIVVFVFIVASDQFTCILLLKAKNLSRHSNYTSIIYHIFRNKVIQGICSFAILINNIGICIAELCLFKGSLRKILSSYVSEDVLDSFYTQPYFIVLFLALLQVPFTLVKKIEKLKFMAFLGVAGIVVFVIALVINFFIQFKERNWECSDQYELIGRDFIQMGSVIPNIMLALSYQMNFFAIFKGMKESRDSKMKKASLAGLLGCSFFYVIVGNMGACRYGRSTNGNFLLNFQRKDIEYQALYILMNGGFLVSVFFSFPVMFFGARNNFINITKMVILSIRGEKEQYTQVNQDTIQQISSFLPNNKKQIQKKQAHIYFLIYTLTLFLIAIGVAIAVDDIEDVFNLVGAIASNAIAFIFPCIFYIAQVNRKNKQKKLSYYISHAMIIFFIPLGIFAIVCNLLVDHNE